jgi:hypothetical protein
MMIHDYRGKFLALVKPTGRGQEQSDPIQAGEKGLPDITE